MSESWLKSAPESTKVHSFDYGAWFRHVITRVRQADSVGFFNVVHGELELTVFKWVGYSIFSFDIFLVDILLPVFSPWFFSRYLNLRIFTDPKYSY